MCLSYLLPGSIADLIQPGNGKNDISTLLQALQAMHGQQGPVERVLVAHLPGRRDATGCSRPLIAAKKNITIVQSVGKWYVDLADR